MTSGPQFGWIFETIVKTARHALTKPGIIIISTFLLLIVWGPKGNPIFTSCLTDWLHADPSKAQFRVQELSYISGFVLLVLIPFSLICFGFKENLKEYGLGIGDFRRGATLFLFALVLGLPVYYLASKNSAMWAEYPLLYQGMTLGEIQRQFQWETFLVYELMYAIFFFVIEFTFRGYMLFGLEEKFGLYAVLIQMLPYIVWHLPKPVPELLGTPLWGLATGAVSLRLRSIWYIFVVHWLLNIFLDIMILAHRGVIQI